MKKGNVKLDLKAWKYFYLKLTSQKNLGVIKLFDNEPNI